MRARILFTSTSEVYGDPKENPQKETYHGNVNPIGPRACYDEGKRVAETMMYAYQAQSGVDVRVARIFNTFGPRMNPYDGRVVSNFIIQVCVPSASQHVSCTGGGWCLSSQTLHVLGGMSTGLPSRGKFLVLERM